MLIIGSLSYLVMVLKSCDGVTGNMWRFCWSQIPELIFCCHSQICDQSEFHHGREIIKFTFPIKIRLQSSNWLQEKKKKKSLLLFKLEITLSGQVLAGSWTSLFLEGHAAPIQQRMESFIPNLISLQLGLSGFQLYPQFESFILDNKK